MCEHCSRRLKTVHKVKLRDFWGLGVMRCEGMHERSFIQMNKSFCVSVPIGNSGRE